MLGSPREPMTVLDVSLRANALVTGLGPLGLRTDTAVALSADSPCVGLPCGSMDDAPLLALTPAGLDGDVLIVSEGVSYLMTNNLQYIMFFENIKEVRGKLDSTEASCRVRVPALGPAESCKGFGLNELDGPVDQSMLVHFVTGKSDDVCAIHIISLAYAFSCVKLKTPPCFQSGASVPRVIDLCGFGFQSGL